MSYDSIEENEVEQSDLYDFKTDSERIKGRKIGDYVDEDYAEYLMRRASHNRPRQHGLSRMEGITDLPDGYYMLEAGELTGDPRDGVANIKQWAEEANIDLVIYNEIRRGVFMPDDLNENDEIMALASLETDYQFCCHDGEIH